MVAMQHTILCLSFKTDFSFDTGVEGMLESQFFGPMASSMPSVISALILIRHPFHYRHFDLTRGYAETPFTRAVVTLYFWALMVGVNVKA